MVSSGDPEFGSIPTGLDTWVPALASPSDLALALMAVAGIGAAVLVLYHRFRRWDRVVLCLAVRVVLGSAADARSVPDLLAQAAGGLAGVIGAAVFIRVARSNLYAYLVPLLCGGLFASGWELVGQGTVWYRANGVFLMLLALLPIAAQLWIKRGPRRLSPAPEPASSLLPSQTACEEPLTPGSSPKKGRGESEDSEASSHHRPL